MDCRLLVVLSVIITAKASKSRGDGGSMYFPEESSAISIDDYPDSNTTEEDVKQFDSSLSLLFDSSKELQQKVYDHINESAMLMDYVQAAFYIEVAKTDDVKYSRLTDTQKEDVQSALVIIYDSVDLSALGHDVANLMITLIKEGVQLKKALPGHAEDRIIRMFHYLNDAIDNRKSCLEYSEYLVMIWIDIVKGDAHDDSSIPANMASLTNIILAMDMNGVGDSGKQNKLNLLSLLSTESHVKFTSKALGGMQQLEDLVQEIMCFNPLSTIEGLMLNISQYDGVSFVNAEDMQAYVEIQKGLLEIREKVMDELTSTSGFVRSPIYGSDIGEQILTYYMDKADNAINPEKAAAYAKMTLQDAHKQLNEMLLSNENYVGAFSGIVMKQNDNLTIDKKTITVSLTKMNLTDSGNGSHAEFQYEGTLIKTDSLQDSLSSSDGDDLRVYALRYKSWSQIINEVIDQHMSELDNDTKLDVKSRRRRSVDSAADDYNYNKSFIGKGGVVSLSTRQQGTKKSLPVTYWIGFHNATTDSGDSLTQCLSCEYLDPATLSWRYEGCYVAKVDEYGITCKCNHTTNFAAFVMPADAHYDVTKHEKMFRILSIIGSVLSVVGLVLSLIIFFIVRKVVRNERLKAHTHLSVALLLVHLLFLGGEAFVRDATLCVTMTVFSHYFLLASFFWMLIEGIFLYLYVIQVFLRSQITSYSWMYLVGWGIPFLIVGISAGVGVHYDVYLSPVERNDCPDGTYAYNTIVEYKTCWLSIDSGIIWTFLVPAIIILIFNSIIMCRTLKICVESMRNSAAMNSRTNSFASSAKSNSSTNEKSFDSSRQYDSYDHLHGQAATDSCGYAISTSPCLLQVMTEEEEQRQRNEYTNDVPMSTTGKDVHESDSYNPSDSSRYYSVSGDSARYSNSRTQSVVYRTSTSQSQGLQVQKQKANNKMAQHTERTKFFNDAKAAIKGAIVLLPILGVPWICGFFSSLSPVFAYLFIILNSTQGVFIFVVYGLKNGEVRRALQRKLHTRHLKHSVDAGIRRSSSATSIARSFLRIGRRRSTVLTTT